MSKPFLIIITLTKLTKDRKKLILYKTATYRTSRTNQSGPTAVYSVVGFIGL